ncbi:hypothetical protein MBM_09852 [Drepanopeziza brunnea f. sp. 'multigermtubi' MB_m1]|uniref:Uncharacterized protein n=1 Tax=Marssonina brunnea f. sp. multigermtubi (strain MB_m1) TaxID=1072389 RepID=K1XHQ3_MARBU|nr:uncharacterized protein MBM_09852 [Drepanopeziza brunnea f. sp. 'multigermtubi' MB_m1]EKD11989.1 hypothetical protein MBM_09852 [Drepanopeziza brunnea f. sp. 'multigermtubi' MB_m1]
MKDDEIAGQSFLLREGACLHQRCGERDITCSNYAHKGRRLPRKGSCLKKERICIKDVEREILPAATVRIKDDDRRAKGKDSYFGKELPGFKEKVVTYQDTALEALAKPSGQGHYLYT